MKKPLVNPFPGCDVLHFRGRLESWEVGYFCSLNKWHWKRCKASRRAQAVKEAPALALELIRESADRWNKVANDALEKERQLRVAATQVESGIADWSVALAKGAAK